MCCLKFSVTLDLDKCSTIISVPLVSRSPTDMASFAGLSLRGAHFGSIKHKADPRFHLQSN